MKKITIVLLLALFTSYAFAQELHCPKPLNQEPGLRHAVAFYAADATLKSRVEEQFTQLMAAGQQAVTVVADLSQLPDVVFILSDAADSASLLAQASQAGSIPILLSSLSAQKAAKQAAKEINNRFYQGERPESSVIFTNGESGYVLFRIPSVIAIPDGSIVAFAEARQEGKTDCAENDIVCKISRDGGHSWGKLILIAESGEASLNNPVSLYLEENNRILLIFQEYPAKLYEGSTRRGVEGEGIMKVFQSYSDDGGLTWSPKRDITRQAKRPDLSAFCSGPGVAIRSVTGPDKGRILIPFNSSGREGWFNLFVYSDDLGDTWNICKGQSSYGTNESQMVQISDTEYLINARCHRYPGDEELQPEGWSAWNFDKVTRQRGMIPLTINGTDVQWGKTVVRKDMPDPLCQGSIIRYSGLKKGETSRLLFSNCASAYTAPMEGRTYQRTPPARINGTVKISYDEGQTWAQSKRIYGDRFTEFQYSVLTPLKANKVGCIFEAFPEIRFATFDLKWLEAK